MNLLQLFKYVNLKFPAFAVTTLTLIVIDRNRFTYCKFRLASSKMNSILRGVCDQLTNFKHRDHGSTKFGFSPISFKKFGFS